MLELAGILVLGMFAQWIAWKIRFPAILPLIVVGLCVGPISEILFDGYKIINPDHIFQGNFLFDVISLCVGIILFEGGLTLKFSEIKELRSNIIALLIVGFLLTLVGGTLAAHFILGIDLKLSLLFGALVIVSGPTVIKPILRNVHANHNIHTILKWESVLIDPLGAFTAVLVFELIDLGPLRISMETIYTLGLIILSGSLIGLVMAHLTIQIIKKNLVPEYLMNVVILGIVILTFALAELFFHESGLLAVTIQGIAIANSKLKKVKTILSFKKDITIILISVLFILLSARINAADFHYIRGGSFLVLLALIYIIRPIIVFISNSNTVVSFKEKVFLSWISPRGIVSAGVASIFSLKLMANEALMADPIFATQVRSILPLTFFIIIGTVVLQGTTAKYFAKWLGVVKHKEKGIVIMGANEVGIFMAKILMFHQIPVLISDTSEAGIREAKLSQIQTYEGSILLDSTIEEVDLSSYSQLMCVTNNTELNLLSCKYLTEEFGENNCYRIATSLEHKTNLEIPENVLFRGLVDYIELAHLIREKKNVLTKEFKTLVELNAFIDQHVEDIVPFFMQRIDGFIFPITQLNITKSIKLKLLYLIK